MMNQKENHAVLFPTPLQGHVNAFMNLAQLLVTRGFFITFVNTEYIHKQMVEASKNTNTLFSLASRGDPELEKRGWRFRFLSIPDGLSPDHGRSSNMGELFVSLQKLGSALQDLLIGNTIDEKSSSVPPITCIVTDCGKRHESAQGYLLAYICSLLYFTEPCQLPSFLSCTDQVASDMKVPRVIFWPISAACSISQSHANFLLSEGHIPVKVKEAQNPEKLITCLPGNIPPLKPSDLISFYRTQDTSDVLYNFFLYESQKQSKADYVLVNTFDDLEGREAAAALSLNGCPALAIGPVFLPNFLQGRDSTSSLWEEEDERWLDMQEPGSVIYVSFGSIAVKSQKQLEQLALGLEGSGHPFLWVLRLDMAEGKSMVLPEGFEERTKDRALFVKWAPQVKVLAHSSVGLFLTHGGWNSILESMSMEVPMVGFPYFADQFLNCRFIKDVWKIGLDFKDVEVDEHKLVSKEEVEDVVKRMMETPEGKKLKDNIVKLKDSATRAVLPGGSSFLNLNTFVEDITLWGTRQI